MATVVAIIKDEAPYLAEWIAFHRLQGFDRFLIYDNESSDGSGEIAERTGAEVIPWLGEIRQLPAYHDACERRLDPDDWAAFIDVDEYLWRPDGQPVVDGLPTTGLAVGVPWAMYGDGGHTERPEGLTIEQYTWREEGPNPHVKQILKPRQVRQFADPHHTDVPFHRATDMLINHYWTRSVAECEAKFERGRADYAVKRTMDEFWRARESLTAVHDPRLAMMWGQQLREALKSWRSPADTQA